jgi:hypothetical protein
MRSVRGREEFFDAFAQASPAQQARKARADVQNVLMDIEQVLPPLTATSKAFDAALRGLKTISEHPARVS